MDKQLKTVVEKLNKALENGSTDYVETGSYVDAIQEAIAALESYEHLLERAMKEGCILINKQGILEISKDAKIMRQVGNYYKVVGEAVGVNINILYEGDDLSSALVSLVGKEGEG